MANTDAKTGLRPVRHIAGGQVRISGRYTVAVDYTTKIYKGDPVQVTVTTNEIILAEAGNVDNIGVFAGCSYNDSNGNVVFSKYWPGVTGNTNIKAFVYEDPNIVYEIQADTLAITDVGALADWAAGTGSTSTGMSGAYLNVGAAGANTATTGKSLRILNLIERPDNAYGAYAKVEVMFTEHVLTGVVSGVGGI